MVNNWILFEEAKFLLPIDVGWAVIGSKIGIYQGVDLYYFTLILKKNELNDFWKWKITFLSCSVELASLTLINSSIFMYLRREPIVFFLFSK